MHYSEIVDITARFHPSCLLCSPPPSCRISLLLSPTTKGRKSKDRAKIVGVKKERRRSENDEVSSKRTKKKKARRDSDSDPGAGPEDHGEDAARGPLEPPRVPRDRPSDAPTPEPPPGAGTEGEGHGEPGPGVNTTAEGRAWTPGDPHHGCSVTGREIQAGRDRPSRGSGCPPDGPGPPSGRDGGGETGPLPGQVGGHQAPLKGRPTAPRSVTPYGGTALDPGPPSHHVRTAARAGLPLPFQHHALGLVGVSPFGGYVLYPYPSFHAPPPFLPHYLPGKPP
ncbi:unnamed protein product [Boreogadus saida]